LRCIFDLELVNGRLVDARLTTPSLIGCQCHLNISSCAELYTGNDVTAQARNRCCREFVNAMYNVLVQQFHDGEFRLSEALAEFIASSYSSLKFFFVADKKAKKLGRFASVNRPLMS